MHNRRAIEDLVEGRHGRPFSLLGVHKGKDDAHLWLRVFLPGAKSASVLQEKEKLPLSQENPAGLFEARLPPSFDPEKPYRVAARYSDDRAEEFHDPYAFRRLLSEYDLHLLGEGNHFRSYEKLGAHLETRQKIPGVRFAVWAPNAQSLAVMGDFNGWSRRRHPMELHPGTGIWQLFIPGLEAGARYKYAVHLRSGEVLDKIDPYGFFFEEPPKTAGIVFELSNYRWQDEKWMAERAEMNGLRAPISVYEVHLGSWKRSNSKQPQPLSYRELADQLVSYVVEMGFTHIELLPITEHPFSGSWGYQGTGYFAPTSRFGTPDEFRYLVDRCHQSGIGVLLDWVPGHFPRDLHALAMFDGSRLYEHADPRQGAHPDWGTLIFNLGRNEVRNFLLSSALFWLDQYHLDGLRVDAVASMLYLDYSREEGEWLPNKHGGKENLEAIDFLRRFNELVYEYHPGTMTIAEESTAWPSVSRPTYLGGLGFTFKWNMGWMHDSLDYISKDPIHRKFHHEKLTFSMLYAFSENYVLPLSHDEVVHGKGSLIDKLPGDVWQKFANLRLYMAYLFGHPGKKLLFMGAEFGQWREWDSEGSLDWHLLNWELHRQVQSFVRELNTLYRREPSMHEVDFNWKGFEWIDFHDQDHSVISFERRAAESADYLIFVFNFTPRPRNNYRIGVPEKTIYRELLNSDAQHWGGSNLGNLGGVEAEEIPKHGREYSIDLTLPPLGALVLKPKTEDSETESRA